MLKICKACEGKGYRWYKVTHGDQYKKCDQCKGAGKVEADALTPGPSPVERARGEKEQLTFLK